MVEDVEVCVDGTPTSTEEKARDTFGDVLEPVFAEHGLSEDDVAGVWESLRECGVVRGEEASVWWTHDLLGGVEEALKAAESRVTKVGLAATLAELGVCVCV